MSLRIGDILVEKQIITQQDLDLALKEHQNTKEFLGQTLVRLNMVTEEKLLRVLAEQQGIQFLDLKDVKVEDSVIENVPAKFAWHYKVMPINIDGNILTVAISNPFDMWPIDDLETNLGYRVEIALAVGSDIAEAIKKYYGVGADTIERILAEAPQEDGEAGEEGALRGGTARSPQRRASIPSSRAVSSIRRPSRTTRSPAYPSTRRPTSGSAYAPHRTP